MTTPPGDNQPDRHPATPSTPPTVVLPRAPQPYPEIAPGELRQIQLEVVGGPMDGLRAFTTEDSLSVGRGKENHLILALDPMVSTQHTKITGDGLHFYLEDVGSRNGTYLESKKIKGRVLLRPGAIFSVGNTHLEFMPR